MGLALGGLNLRGGETRLPLPLGMLAQPLVGGVVPRPGREGRQAQRRIVAEILLVGVPPRQQIPVEVRVGVQALLRMPGGAPARTRLAARTHGAPSRDGGVQTHKPMDGTCDSPL